MTIFLTVTTDWWRCNALVGSVEYPISAECDVRSVKPHGTGDIEIALIYHLTKLRHEYYHALDLLGVIIDWVMKILHAILFAEERKFV